MNPWRLAASLTTALWLVASIMPQARAQENDDKGRLEALRSLQTIGLAMFNFHGKNDCFPPAYAQSEEGKPLLSCASSSCRCWATSNSTKSST